MAYPTHLQVANNNIKDLIMQNHYHRLLTLALILSPSIGLAVAPAEWNLPNQNGMSSTFTLNQNCNNPPMEHHRTLGLYAAKR